ncbi:hypothetical protein N7532_010288 [Penicillium argentinense]|uniref:Protein kinase domain-containing protein n=1 Tax=Penicillium argentinense TaxID=1131581 RepID=A0A9W9JYE1_9EURO|nr:uncharacterized protein N7532_010288 [Penicillium argentinense]KAJ5085517.1 hypothetical protein N7532_010288 [Penicillium argentinense]
MKFAPSYSIALDASHLDMPLDMHSKPATGGSDPLADTHDQTRAVRGHGINGMDSKMPSYPGLDRWQLLDLLGTGAFSHVYRASDREGKMGEVAIKVMKKYEMKEPHKANLQKEIQIMRQLDHNNISRLIDVIETNQYCHIVLELCTGGELFNQLVKLTYLSEDLSRHVILQVAQAVLYLHQTGIVHRDIKPENILFNSIPVEPSKTPKPTLPGEENKVDEGDFVPGVGGGGIGEVKLADFGLSKIIAGAPTATPCGTMSYAAPEIVRDEKYTTGVDMWALGCVLYTLLAGYPPFYDPNTKVLMKKVSTGDYAFDSPWWNDISKDAKDIVSKLLTVESDKRLTIEEFINHPWIQKASKTTLETEEPSTIADTESQSDGSSTTAPPTPRDDRDDGTPVPPEALHESHVEARTPGFMNVRELFGVVFSAHQREHDIRDHEIASRVENDTRKSKTNIHDKLHLGNSALLQKRGVQQNRA